MTQAIRIYEHGGPDVMKWEAIEVGNPGEKEMRVRHTAVVSITSTLTIAPVCTKFLCRA